VLAHALRVRFDATLAIDADLDLSALMRATERSPTPSPTGVRAQLAPVNASFARFDL